jgi:TrmH family RNA methyltransferase
MSYEHRDNGPRKVGQVKEVTSLANPIIKDIKALSDKKTREQSGTFMAEGLKLVIDAIELGWTIRTLVYAKAAKSKPLVEQMAAKTVASGGLVLEVSEKVLSSITRRDNPQMVVGIFESRWKPLRDIRPGRARRGSRSTAFATPAISARSSARPTPPALPASSSSARPPIRFRWKRCAPPWARSSPCRSTRATPEEFIAWKKQAGVSVVATHLAGSVDYRTIDYKKKPVVILMGNEQSGLPEQLAREADALARIPQQGLADSLNLAVASAVMLFEARRHLLSLSEAK